MIKILNLLKTVLPSPGLCLGILLIVLATSGISARFAYKYAFNHQQVKIDEIVNKRQVERSEWNNQLASAQLDAWRKLDEWKSTAHQIFVTRTEIITEWKTKYVSDPRCGLSLPAVQAVNRLVEVN